MRAPIRAIVIGLVAALRTPGWIARRLPRLLVPAAARGRRRAGAPPMSVRSAYVALRVLARVPGRRWRNTCLYRSVAKCLILREHGVPARVVLGVARENEEVAAHAWVEVGDRPGETGHGGARRRLLWLRQTVPESGGAR